METFDSTKRGLFEILKDVEKGKIQLPDFQRGWVWSDNRIKGLIASVAKGFPIGAIMLLEIGNENICFKTKPVEGANISDSVNPEFLILDGQQRITSLFQAIITNEVVNTRNEKGYEIKRWYYIDMKKALDPDADLEESIFSINENKVITENIGRDIKLDLRTQEDEFRNLMYPVCMVDESNEWWIKYFEYWQYDKEKIQFWSEFQKKIINGFAGYELPVITMKKENPKEAVCQVFEKVNTGGVPLTVFELLTATYAASGFDLKDSWNNTFKLFKKHSKILSFTSNTDIIQSITLYSTYKKRLRYIAETNDFDNAPGVSAKRKSMLALSVDEYKKYIKDVENGYIKAAEILLENHIYTARDLPYTTQLIPMSVIISELGKEIDNMTSKAKLMRWLWCGVLGELYGGANETRYALVLYNI